MRRLYFFLKKFDKLIILVFFVSLLFRLWGITTQFEVWDETTVVRYGEEYLNFIRRMDFSKESWSLNKEHPPVSKYFYGTSRLISLNVPYFRNILDQEYPIGKRYTFQRILSTIIGSLTICITYLMVRKFYSKNVAFLAAILLSFTPYFIAHSRMATQENLVTFLITISVYYFISGLIKTHCIFSGNSGSEAYLKSKEFLASGIFLGLGLGTKYNAIFFLCYFALISAIFFGKSFIRKPKLIFRNYIILIPVLTFLVLFVIWPWLWFGNPIQQFLISTGSRVGFTRIDKPATEYFLGEYPHHSPWYYFIVYFYATTPPILLFAFLLFVAKNLYNLSQCLVKKKQPEYSARLAKFDLLMLLYFLTPLLATFSPLKMDGIRYIFPIYVPLAICSALGFSFLFSKLFVFINSKYSVVLIPAIYMSIIFSLVYLNITLHPYYMDYYNIMVGGPQNVYENRLFDFGYWGEGLRYAANFINENAMPGSKVMIYAVPNHVLPEFRKDLYIIKHPPTDDVSYMLVNPTGSWLLDAEEKRTPFSSEYKYDPIFEEKTYDETPIVTVYKVGKKDDYGK